MGLGLSVPHCPDLAGEGSHGGPAGSAQEGGEFA